MRRPSVDAIDTAFNPKVILAARPAPGPDLRQFARRSLHRVIVKTGMSSADFGGSVGPQGRGAGPINGDARSDHLRRRAAGPHKQRSGRGR